MSDVEITEVRSAHVFDEAALGAYLQEHVADFMGCLLYTSDAADE